MQKCFINTSPPRIPARRASEGKVTIPSRRASEGKLTIPARRASAGNGQYQPAAQAQGTDNTSPPRKRREPTAFHFLQNNTIQWSVEG
jgi:hypothetical protein